MLGDLHDAWCSLAIGRALGLPWPWHGPFNVFGSMGASLETGNCRFCKHCAKSPISWRLENKKATKHCSIVWGVFVKRTSSLIILCKHFSKGGLYWGTWKKFIKWSTEVYGKRLQKLTLRELSLGWADYRQEWVWNEIGQETGSSHMSELVNKSA